MSGTLYVVATPLGNLDDITLRAIATLRSVALVVCEDTRRTAKLLGRFEITAPMLSSHRFNERGRIETVLAALREGKGVALVSDSGTPCIADPGAQLVRAALSAGVAVSPVPGASAVTGILSVSGFGADRYVFEGFLPHRPGERRRRLRELRAEARTTVFFEAPHRVLQTLRDLQEVIGDRPVVVGRELTKLHESILAGTPAEIANRLGAEPRGEIAVVMAGAGDGTTGETDVAAQRLLECWRRGLERSGGARRTALREVARELGLERDELERRLAELGSTEGSPSR